MGSKLYNEQVYAWIIPYLDSNVINITHNTLDNNNKKYEVSFATFIDKKSNILCEINKVFYVYSKNGTVEYQVNIAKGSDRDPYYFQQCMLSLE